MNEHATRLRLLFVGNSHTFFNDMPEMVAERFRKDGYDCEVAMIAHGGWSLSQLVEEPEVQFNIRYGHYDYVMLQDMSNPFESERRFMRSIAILVKWVREAGARPILYLPWTRCDGEDRQAAMTASYKKASAEYEVPLAPAGEFGGITAENIRRPRCIMRTARMLQRRDQNLQPDIFIVQFLQI